MRWQCGDGAAELCAPIQQFDAVGAVRNEGNSIPPRSCPVLRPFHGIKIRSAGSREHEQDHVTNAAAIVTPRSSQRGPCDTIKRRTPESHSKLQVVVCALPQPPMQSKTFDFVRPRCSVSDFGCLVLSENAARLDLNMSSIAYRRRCLLLVVELDRVSWQHLETSSLVLRFARLQPLCATSAATLTGRSVRTRPTKAC